MSYRSMWNRGGGRVPSPFKVRSTIFTRQPLLFAAIAVAAGAAVGYAVRESLSLIVLLVFAILTAALAYVFHRLRRGGWAALVSMLACFQAGALIAMLALPAWYGQWGENTKYEWVTGVVTERRHGAKSDTLVVGNITVSENGFERKLDGKIALTASQSREDELAAEAIAVPAKLPEGRWEKGLAEDLRVGDRVLLTDIYLQLPIEPGIDGMFNARLYWAEKNVRFTAYADDSRIQVQTGRGFSRVMDSFRLWLYDRMQQDMGEEGTALTAALLLGWTAELGDFREDYAALGISHVLAVSGLHVSLLIMVVNAWAHRRRWMRMQRYLAQGVLIMGYFLLAGARPSFNRVLFMMLFSIGAELVGRENDTVNSLAAAFLVQFLLSPLSVFTSSCQLTYLATLALLLLSDVAPRQFLLGTSVISMLIAWAILPFAGEQGYPLITGAANALITPVYSVMVGTSFIYLLISPIPGLRSLFGMVVGRVAAGLQRLVQIIGHAFPMLHLPFQGGWGFMLASAALVLMASPRILGKKKWLRRTCLVLAAGMLVISLAASQMRAVPRVIVIGAGYHTAVLVEDTRESALIVSDEVYGAGDAAKSGYRGNVDTLVFHGTRLSDLETALQEVGDIKRVVIRQSYAEDFPDWVDTLLERRGMSCVLLEDDAPLALGTFTMQYKGEGVILQKNEWTLRYAGKAEGEDIYVVDYASGGAWKRAESADTIVYAQPYSQRGLDEPVANGYNTIRHGAWLRQWP